MMVMTTPRFTAASNRLLRASRMSAMVGVDIMKVRVAVSRSSAIFDRTRCLPVMVKTSWGSPLSIRTSCISWRLSKTVSTCLRTFSLALDGVSGLKIMGRPRVDIA